MRLLDLAASFTQALPLADGIHTGLQYVCPSDPRRKKSHAILFDVPIYPYGDVIPPAVMQYLNANEGYRVQPKWHRVGVTLETLTLSPSISYPCCHIVVNDGKVDQ